MALTTVERLIKVANKFKKKHKVFTYAEVTEAFKSEYPGEFMSKNIVGMFLEKYNISSGHNDPWEKNVIETKPITSPPVKPIQKESPPPPKPVVQTVVKSLPRKPETDFTKMFLDALKKPSPEKTPD